MRETVSTASGLLQPRQLGRIELHRGAAVRDEDDRGHLVGEPLPHDELVAVTRRREPCRRLPVDVADVVAGPVGPRARDVGASASPDARRSHPARSRSGGGADGGGSPRSRPSQDDAQDRRARAPPTARAGAPGRRRAFGTPRARSRGRRAGWLGDERRREDDAMCDDRQEERLDVLRRDEVAAVDQRPGAGRSLEREARAHRRARARPSRARGSPSTSSTIQRRISSST